MSRLAAPACFTALCTVVLTTVLPARAEFAVQDGDRVVFWGDSITDNADYPRTIENYVRGRYPRWKIDFFNLGWGGDIASTTRIQRDLPPLKPTLVLINLGMNDGCYAPFSEENTARFLAGMKQLITVIRTRTQARIMLITPPPYEPGVGTDDQAKQLSTFYPQTLQKMSQRLIDFGKGEGIPVVDLNAMCAQAVAQYRAADPSLTFSVDGIHPNANGQALIAYLLLKGLGADGDILRLAIDAKTGQVLQSHNQTISYFASTKEGFSFTRKVSAFPFRTSGEAPAFDRATWYDALNRNTIAVSNLTAPYYILALNDDQHPLRVCTKEELERGVNLSLYDLGLPEDKLASFIASNVREMHDARYRRWRWLLLKGVPNSYVNPPFAAETSESLLLAEKAQTISTFLASEQLFGEEYVLKFIASESGDLLPDLPAGSSLSLLGAAHSTVAGTWTSGGTLRELAADAGAKAHGFTCDRNTKAWAWAGWGFGVAHSGNPAPLDISGYSAVQVVYRGLDGPQTLSVGFASASGDRGVPSESVQVGGPAGTNTVVELPLERFRNGKFDPTKLSGVTFGISGANYGIDTRPGTDSGTVSVRFIRFVDRK